MRDNDYARRPVRPASALVAPAASSKHAKSVWSRRQNVCGQHL